MKCPYCEKEIKINELVDNSKSLGANVKHIVYVCPHCKKILSVAMIGG